MTDIKMVERGGKEYESYACSECGENAVASYVDGVRKRMVDRRLCYSCNYWCDFLKTKPHTIIGGRTYSPGSRTSGPMRGMAGRRFDIEYFAGPHAGKRITTFDLWAGSDIPERYREHFPDTAKFINGGSKENVGGTTCWGPSDSASDPYPLPIKAGIR
jgi:hypothetical protein